MPGIEREMMKDHILPGDIQMFDGFPPGQQSIMNMEMMQLSALIIEPDPILNTRIRGPDRRHHTLESQFQNHRLEPTCIFFMNKDIEIGFSRKAFVQMYIAFKRNKPHFFIL